MQADHVTGVYFREFSRTDNSRKTIAVFYIKRTPDAGWSEYIQRQTLHFLWHLTAMLADGYSTRNYGDLFPDLYIPDGNGCQIVPTGLEDGHSIRVLHKQWNDMQIDCFKMMVQSLACLYDWTVEIG
jgi:hypothetical protein